MSLVGILSDTHGALPVAAEIALSDCDYIIHAGDICDLGILPSLRCYAPVVAVLGNNDFPEYGEDVQRFARPIIDGVRFLVAHYPQEVRPGPFGSKALPPGDPIPQVSVHGHTHIPDLRVGADARPAQLLICPGSVSRPRGGLPASIAKLVVEDGKVKDAWIESIRGGEVLMRL